MKNSFVLSILISFSTLFFSCASYIPYAYDDTYYSPNNDPVKQVQKNPREDFNKTNDINYDGSYTNRYQEEEKPADYPRSMYNNRYTEAERNDNTTAQEGQNNVVINNNVDTQDEYYDEEYAQTLQQINSPVRRFNTYDPYQRDRILFTQDPFFAAPTLYGSYAFWDPFTPRIGINAGWNSWNGWNVGVGVGFGNLGYGYCPPIYDPWNPYRGRGYNGWNSWNAWNDPFFNPYNPWNGYGYNNFNAGYNQGFANGYYNNNRNTNFGSNGEVNTSNKRYYNTPRGEKGSRTFNGNAADRPTRPGTTTTNNKSNGTTTATRPSRPTRPTAVTKSPSAVTPKSSTTTVSPSVTTRPQRPTPQKYESTRTPDSYARPQIIERPVTTTPATTKPNVQAKPQNPSQSRPTYTPRQNNTYNEQRSVQPQRQQTTTRPQQQSTPTYNRSRPTYNRSTPSYTPSAPSRSGGGGSRSVPSRPSRPQRR